MATERFEPADYARLFGVSEREARRMACRDRDECAKRAKRAGMIVATWKEGAAFVAAMKEGTNG